MFTILLRVKPQLFSEVQLFDFPNASPLAKEKMFGMLLQQAQQLIDIVASEEDEDEDEEARASELETIATWIWEITGMISTKRGQVFEDFRGSTPCKFLFTEDRDTSHQQMAV